MTRYLARPSVGDGHCEVVRVSEVRYTARNQHICGNPYCQSTDTYERHTTYHGVYHVDIVCQTCGWVDYDTEGGV